METAASDWLESIYGWLEAVHVSPSALAGATLFLSLAFLLALREAAAWFLKTHDLKRDLARLEELSLQLEGQIRSVRDSIDRLADARSRTPTAEGSGEKPKPEQATPAPPVERASPKPAAREQRRTFALKHGLQAPRD